MTPIQQMLLGVGAKKKTYMDDIFSTYLWEGNATSGRAINNGINLSGEGGMTWIKRRSSNGGNNCLFDTERGAGKLLIGNTNGTESTSTARMSAFNSNGFTIGSDSGTNGANEDFTSWTFRKAPGFFDVVTWTQSGSNGSARTLNHSLGCVPGFIMLKQTTGTENWICYHRDFATNGFIKLNSTHAVGSDANASVNSVSSTQFVVGADNNKVGSYVAYLFAGGESTAATARSVDFVSSNSDYLKVPTHTDFNLGSNNFTIECWVKSTQAHSGYKTLLGQYDNTYAQMIRYNSSDIGSGWSWFGGSGKTCFGQAINDDQWHHIAVVRNGDVITTYTDGTKNNTLAYTGSVTSSTEDFYFGKRGGSGELFNGKISNFRLVNGTAVYTSSFKPPTAPLTNITNTKLLCLQDSTVTTATVSPTTIASTAMPDASTDSPFDDPAAFTFGDSKEGIIKCGSYVGNGSSTGPEINLGWEPQWILIKNTDLSSENWWILDSMRGIVSNGVEASLSPNTDVSESDINLIDLTATGFKTQTTDDKVNGDGHDYIYIAIRRPDGYVGKPAEAGTDVFAMDTGNSSNTIPTFDSGFPVDFALYRTFNSSSTWWATSRLIGTNELKTHESDAQSTYADNTWDSNVGWCENGNGANDISHMWKRHAGFDVVTYTGTSVGPRSIPHSLGRIPEMIVVKRRNNSEDWTVYHSGMGSPAINYHMQWNNDNARYDGSSNHYVWGGVAPTSTHFSVGGSANPDRTNNSNSDYIAMLFASVDGISDVGYYDGSESEQTITTGFQPRFVIIKRVNAAENWYVLDTTRGWASGVDQALELNTTTAQDNSYDFGAPTSTGFTLTGNNLRFNNGGDKFIYYAHA